MTNQPIEQAVPLDDLARAERVAEHVNIAQVRMVDSDTLLSEYGGPIPKLARSTQKAKTELRERGEQAFLHVEAEFVFELAHEGEESKDAPPVSVRAVFCVDYEIDSVDGFEEADFSAFGRVNGVYNTWPFWREFVYSTMARMGLPPVSMPVYRVVPGQLQAKSTPQATDPAA